ncbi:MAG: pyridoxamine 5'-phosphate oxidase family protein [Rhodobacteraceae bacterium]|nr:pyridoxamine 5'-phosphate oxidase family protein [Paracoccaceae bacterium]
MSEWYETLDGVYGRAWSLLIRGTNDPKHDARTPTLATMSATGPQQRTLVLRQTDKEGGRIILYTDKASAKVGEIIADPRVSLHVWDKRSQIQLRLAATASLAPGDPKLWEKMPEGAREVYGVEPPPGTPLEDPLSFERTSNADKFLCVTLTLHEIELVTLAPDPHRRARFRRVDGWAGQWLAP